MSIRTIISIFALGAGLTCSAASADVIAERQANFKINGQSMKAIQAAVGSGDTATIAERARVIADWSARMTEYFPEGSNTGKTDARAEIWQDFDRFAAYAGDAEKAALELAALADAGAGAGELGGGLGKLAGTCKTCHQSFKK